MKRTPLPVLVGTRYHTPGYPLTGPIPREPTIVTKVKAKPQTTLFNLDDIKIVTEARWHIGISSASHLEDPCSNPSKGQICPTAHIYMKEHQK